ncbi:MAG: ribonuclease J [Candidatus Paracaedibacteraceae bacterium]|nr:ribonuclease J [Candidatus Paracaedibacteraceae bacterium]
MTAYTPIKDIVPSKNDFWFLPLGGSNEIGMNLNLFGYNNQWLIVDLGITFHDRNGVDVIAPDPSFLIQHRDKIGGIVLTHAHEDHIGAIPYLWPYLRCPIYATPFTMRILRQKLAEKSWKNDVPLIEIPLCGTFNVGDFKVEYITLTHSILEPNALRIETPHGVILHTGDWKIDPNPMIGEATDIKRLKEIGDEGVLAMICDSTNVFNNGEAGSEKDVHDEMAKLMATFPDNRLTVACFASNVARLETVAKIAASLGRQVALVGRSMHRMVSAAKDSGYLKELPQFISDTDAMKLPDSKVCFITTGSQGEARAALARIAGDQHPVVKYTENDVVLFSSRMIPGNEKNISAVQNRLVHKGIRIVTSSEEDIHVSGHPARDELRQMYEWVRPEVLIPVHGEARHLDEHARFALECGVETAVIPENGSIIQLKKGDTCEIDYIQTGRWVYDGNRMIDMKSNVLKDRQKLSTDGLVAATLIIDASNQLLQAPDLTLIGLCDSPEEKSVLEREIYLAVQDSLTRGYRSDDDRIEAVKAIIRKATNRYLDKKPVVTVHIIVAEI